jgi:multidrug efflux pump subunit AcrA (membrane-fusion protein)
MITTRRTSLLLFLSLLVWGCGEDAEETAAGTREKPLVLVSKAEAVSEAISFSALGTVVAAKSITVSAPFEGEIKTVHLRRGDRAEGKAPAVDLSIEPLQELLLSARLELSMAEINRDLLKERLRSARMNQEAARLLVRRRERALEAAREELERGRRKLEETRILVEAGSLPEKRSEAEEDAVKDAERLVENTVSLLEADMLNIFIPPETHPDVAIAELNLAIGETRARAAGLEVERYLKMVEKSGIRVPFDSVVLALYRNEGERIARDEPIISFYDPSSLEISVMLPQKDILLLETGCAAHIDCSPGDTGRLKSLVTRIIAVTGSSGMAEVRLACPPGERCFLPGASFRVRIESRERVRGIALLPEMIQRHDGGESGVYLVSGGRCMFRPVSLSSRIPGRRIITGGVREGELLCLSIPPRFRDGMEVEYLLKEEP